MEDYKKDIINLLSRYYSPIGADSEKRFFATIEVLSMLRGVVPSKPFDEHDIYEILKEQGYHQERETTEEGIIFKWVLYEI